MIPSFVFSAKEESLKLLRNSETISVIQNKLITVTVFYRFLIYNPKKILHAVRLVRQRNRLDYEKDCWRIMSKIIDDNEEACSIFVRCGGIIIFLMGVEINPKGDIRDAMG